MASELIIKNKKLFFHVSGAELSSQKKYSNFINSVYKDCPNLNDHNYKFYGMIENIPQFLAGADIFVCTSKTEAGPMTVWEAMSMGIAVITTDVGSVRQYIDDGESGFIVPVNDTKALVDRVIKLIENPSLIEKFGTASRKIAVNRLDVSIAAKKYANFYSKIINNYNSIG